MDSLESAGLISYLRSQQRVLKKNAFSLSPIFYSSFFVLFKSTHILTIVESPHYSNNINVLKKIKLKGVRKPLKI